MTGEEERETSVHTSYASAEDFLAAYARDLVHGALFSPGEAPHRAGEPVRVVLEFAFCGRRVELEGEVIAVLSPELARTGATPGISVKLAITGDALRSRLEEATGLSLSDVEGEPPQSARKAVRFAARASVVLEVDGRHFPAETVEVSQNGMLALLSGVDLGEGTQVRVVLAHPASADALTLEGRVTNQARCDHGVMAIGVQFLYAMDRVDAVTKFIDDLRGFHHARKLGGVSGSLRDTSFEDVLETFSSISNAGTIQLSRGKDEGKIVYRDGWLLCAITGLVTGSKALGRMFTWNDARFEFHPAVEPFDSPEPPLPFSPAILAAAVNRDEIAHLNLGALDPEGGFALAEELLAAIKPELDELQGEVAEHAGMGFPLGAILDILPASDAAIYKALARLLEAGIVTPN